jgi:hypothetical protein
VRTTLTLDDDVAAKLKAEIRRSGRPFKEVVNQFLRLGINSRRESAVKGEPFVVEARSLGRLRPGVSLDNVGELLEQIEGPSHR